MRAKTLALSAVLVLLGWGAVAFFWTRLHLISALALIFIAGVYGLHRLHAAGLPAAPRRRLQHEGDPEAKLSWGRWLAGLLALAAGYYAWTALDKGAWMGVLRWLVAGAVAWRFALPTGLPRLPRAAWLALFAVVLAASAAFRFYKVGEIPLGSAGVDEPRLMWAAQDIVNGQRPSFATKGGALADGVLPFYAQALSLKVFGPSFKGFRTGGAMVGIVTTALVFAAGLLLGGPWIAAAAGLLFAVSLWPVTINRAQYLVGETHLVVLLAVLALWTAAQNSRGWAWALAGLAWAACFNVYTAAQVMILIFPVGWALLYLLQPSRRAELRAGLTPLLGGFLLGLAPLILWVLQTGEPAWRAIAGPYVAGHTAGNLGATGQTLMGRLDALVGRVLPQLTRDLGLFVSRGPFNPWYFPPAYPIVDAPLRLAFLLGFSLCLSRLRHPLYAFLLAWWTLGLLPLLMAVPEHNPNDRRAMMSMLPLILIAGAGLAHGAAVLGGFLREAPRRWLSLALLAGFFAWAAPMGWSHYFVRNAGDEAMLRWNQVHVMDATLAVAEERRAHPAAVISTRPPYGDDFAFPLPEPNRGEFINLNPGMDLRYVVAESGYYAKGSFWGALHWAVEATQTPQPQELLVVLTPFYFTLEPLLQDLGGKLVRDLPVHSSADGKRINEGLGLMREGQSATRIWRLPSLSAPQVAALEARYPAQCSITPLTAPKGLLENAGPTGSPASRKALASYLRGDAGWKRQPATTFALPEASFWGPDGNMAQDVRAPHEVRLSFDIELPQGGSYAFGAACSQYTEVQIDGRRAFVYDYPQIGIEEILRGDVGPALALTPGRHHLSARQVCVNSSTVSNQMLRLLWKKPGGELEALPLTLMAPAKPTRP